MVGVIGCFGLIFLHRGTTRAIPTSRVTDFNDCHGVVPLVTLELIVRPARSVAPFANVKCLTSNLLPLSGQDRFPRFRYECGVILSKRFNQFAFQRGQHIG